MAIVNNHHAFMQIALNLAGRGLGRTWPNPSVGCVIVKDNRIISCGYNGFLIGENFMKHKNPVLACKKFIKSI